MSSSTDMPAGSTEIFLVRLRRDMDFSADARPQLPRECPVRLCAELPPADHHKLQNDLGGGILVLRVPIILSLRATRAIGVYMTSVGKLPVDLAPWCKVYGVRVNGGETNADW